jgi:hypothetical protein
MKPILAAILLMVSALFLLTTSALRSQSPAPERNLQSALDKAKRENKLLFVQYGSTTCGYCRMLREMVKSGKVELDSEDFVYLDLLTDTPGNIKAFDTYFHRGIGLPFIAIIAPDGKEIGSHMRADEEPLNDLIKKSKAYLLHLKRQANKTLAANPNRAAFTLS